MNIKKTVIAATLLLPALAWAQQSSGKIDTNGLTYDFVGVGYANIMIDTTFRATTAGRRAARPSNGAPAVRRRVGP